MQLDNPEQVPWDTLDKFWSRNLVLPEFYSFCLPKGRYRLLQKNKFPRLLIRTSFFFF